MEVLWDVGCVHASRRAAPSSQRPTLASRLPVGEGASHVA